MSCLPSLDVVVTSERLTGTSAFTSAVNIPGEDRPDPLPVLVPADAVAGLDFPAGAGKPLSSGASCGPRHPTISMASAETAHTHPISGQTLTKVRQAAFRFRFPSDFPRGDSRNMPARP
jgi:hypothetical protein